MSCAKHIHSLVCHCLLKRLPINQVQCENFFASNHKQCHTLLQSCTAAMSEQDLEAQTASQKSTQSFENTRRDFQHIVGQGCFLCLESHEKGEYAVLVPCLRPSKPRGVSGWSCAFSGNPKIIYEMVQPWKRSREADSEIWR